MGGSEVSTSVVTWSEM